MKTHNAQLQGASFLSQGTPAWRARFITLVEDLFRELGYPAPGMTYEFDEPLAVKMEVDELGVAVAHRPAQQPEELLMLCHGPLAMDELAAADTLSWLLAANGGACSDTISVDPDTHDLVLAAHVRLDQVDPHDIEFRAERMAAQVRALMGRIRAGVAPTQETPARPVDVSGDEAAPFEAVTRDLYSRLGIDTGSQASGPAGMSPAMERDGVRFRLHHGDLHDISKASLECRFGVLPQDACAMQAELLQLLFLNRAFVELGASSAFSFDSELGEAVFWRTLDLRAVTGEDIVLTMDHLAVQVHAWRLTQHERWPSLPGFGFPAGLRP